MCLSVQLQGVLPKGSQTHFRSIITDDHLRVKGSNGSIYAIGDAATIEQVLFLCKLLFWDTTVTHDHWKAATVASALTEI